MYVSMCASVSVYPGKREREREVNKHIALFQVIKKLIDSASTI